MLSFVLLFSTLSQSIVATTVYAGNILMMEQDSELPVKEDQADITDQDHQEKNTDTENTNSDKEQGTEESTDSDSYRICIKYKGVKSMKFDVKTQGKKMEVALEGRMDSATAPGFEKEIFQKLDGVTELVLDFTDLAYLSSAGLRVLLSCQKKMNAAKGSMVVKHVNEIIMEVFEATGFDSILTVEQ